MVIKVKTKSGVIKSAPPIQSTPTFHIPAITGAPIRTPNIIIRAIKIMLMDIRMLIHPKQTAEELEKYSQFANLVYGRK